MPAPKPRLAAFLRGMNLGKRRITNEELVACFADLGFTDVEAYQAAGNVVFRAGGAVEKVRLTLERGLRAALGYEVPTFLRTGEAVRALAEARPFAGRPSSGRGGKVQVALLAAPAPAGAAEALRPFETDADWLAIHGDALFWWPERGVGVSQLDLRGLEGALGPATVRTQGTLERMAARFWGG